MEFKDYMPAEDEEMVRENGEELSEIEQSKVGIMRAIVEREDPSAKEMDDLMIRRFLRARELDIEKASALFLKYLSWKREFLPKGFIPESDIPNDLAQNKLFMQGFDKQGRPIVVGFGGRHRPSKTTVEETKRFVVYVLEKICARMPSGPSTQEKFLAIVDLEGWGYTSSDVRAYLAALSILQIVFVENKKLSSTLLGDIDESQLPDIYGGKLPLVPIQDS
ncbi:phosphatidylinositol transfer protein 3-like isoform X2 [Tripterygium wilfordii]|uniref:phosphatidylinositol transfer protein 3-like isoform X2 n=1 Tax=Tripterygium wilfordii TaxID=458696 RepID=UPI0018F827A0|nr:phosphatidylinositol transfer protein 3-like isoform X2 [Tripterygium wilfordii]